MWHDAAAPGEEPVRGLLEDALHRQQVPRRIGQGVEFAIFQVARAAIDVDGTRVVAPGHAGHIPDGGKVADGVEEPVTELGEGAFGFADEAEVGNGVAFERLFGHDGRVRAAQCDDHLRQEFPKPLRHADGRSEGGGDAGDAEDRGGEAADAEFDVVVDVGIEDADVVALFDEDAGEVHDAEIRQIVTVGYARLKESDAAIAT